jgi:hypothetical protein
MWEDWLPRLKGNITTGGVKVSAERFQTGLDPSAIASSSFSSSIYAWSFNGQAF